MAKGSEYEYWDESTYKANEDVYRCFAYKVTDLGLQLTQVSKLFFDMHQSRYHSNYQNSFPRVLEVIAMV